MDDQTARARVLPFSINFLAEPGMEHLSLKAPDRLSIGVEATRARPPDFGPVTDER